jgi:hypothetical protein
MFLNWKDAARDKEEWRRKIWRPWPKNVPKRHRKK